MLRNDDIYEYISTPYDLLVSKEDYEGNIPAALIQIADFKQKDVADLGAGTGRLTQMVAAEAKSIVAVDFAADMLKVAANKLTEAGLKNWKTCVSDLRHIPSLEDESVDIVLAGWSVCYLSSSDHQEWELHLEQVITEMERILRPQGTIIILETLGTGNTEPVPPDFLRKYFEALEQKYGFNPKVIRTDYAFDSAEQAEQLCRDFFGDELGDVIREEKTNIVPECTGIWWRTALKG